MATLRDIKRRISGVKNTAKITQAMKMVSAAKLKRAQTSIESARPYFEKLEDMLSNLVGAVGEDYTNPLIEVRSEVRNVAFVVIAADRGLCGSFNSGLFRHVAAYLNKDFKEEHPDATAQIIPVGNRSCDYFDKRGYNIIEKFKDVFGELDYSTAQAILRLLKHKFISGEIDKAVIFFNEFVSVVRQSPMQKQLLPIEPKAEEELEESSAAAVDYIFEPQKDMILDELLPKNLDIQCWRALLESNAAEHAARMMAMDNATSNAEDLIQHLQLVYNKERQSAITTEMLEIVSGANALKKE
jgi:F-type H+-transporting ATPase subunit gamma